MPVIDAHAHLGRWLTGDWAISEPAALVSAMDAGNVETIVNLDGRWGEELEANLARFDRAYPGRFATFCHADWGYLSQDADRVGTRLADCLSRSADAGARGLKVWKDLGLSVTDGKGTLVLPDDPRLTPLWQRAADIGVPVAIHTADPLAFFEPLDMHNERLEELLEHPEWSYADPRFPRFLRLIAALETLVAAHPATTFIGVHVGCFAEDLGWVGQMLDTYPNFNIDIAGRAAELGRQPRTARNLLTRHPSRVLFGTDGIPPVPGIYDSYARLLETAEEYFPYAPGEPPPQGRWMIYGLELGPQILAQIYSGNARRLILRN
jgi:amidohydrolase family protein